MPLMNLDTQPPPPVIEPAPPPPKRADAGQVGAGAFDQHLQRAGQTPAAAASADDDATDRENEPDRQTPSAAQGQTDDLQRTSADQPADDTTPPTEPSKAQNDPPSEVEAVSDTAEQAEGSETDGETAAAGSSREPDEVEAGRGGEDPCGAEIANACAPPKENDANEAVRPKEESGGSRAVAPEESNKPAAAPRLRPNPVTEEPCRPQAEATGEEDAAVAEPTEDNEGNGSRQTGGRVGQPTRQPVAQAATTDQPTAVNQEQGENAPAASTATDARPLKKRPEVQASRENSRRHGERNPVAGRQGLQVSIPQASPLRAEPHGTLDSQATSTGTTAPADQGKAEAGDAAMKPTTGGRQAGETGTSERVASNQTRHTATPTEHRETSAAEQADRVRFVHRVARAFQAAGGRRGTVRLRLHPPELGSLRLELTVRNGLMTARLETETNAARSLLLDNLPALRERLAEHDVRIQRFDVELGNRSPGGSAQQPGDHPHWHDDSQAKTSRATADREIETDDTGALRRVSRLGGVTQFDVTI